MLSYMLSILKVFFEEICLVFDVREYDSTIKDMQIVIEDVKGSKIKFSAKNLYFLERREFTDLNLRLAYA